jgi:uncharacterized integral membrane protein
MDNGAMSPSRLLADLGALRSVLVGCTLLLIILSPFADGTTHVRGAALFTSVVAPALMVIFVFVLMLDIVMTSVFAIDATAERRAKMRRAVRLEILSLLTLLGAWTPFLLRMFGVWPQA